MSNANDPAFTLETESCYHLGLTKREYFAAMAMQALVAHDGEFLGGGANSAVKYADALLAELAKR